MAKQVRPLPYERRAKKAGAGIVKPGGAPPVSAWKWPKWKLSEAAKAGQAPEYLHIDVETKAETALGSYSPPGAEMRVFAAKVATA